MRKQRIFTSSLSGKSFASSSFDRCVRAFMGLSARSGSHAPTITCALSQSLRSNASAYIPKEMLHIGRKLREEAIYHVKGLFKTFYTNFCTAKWNEKPAFRLTDVCHKQNTTACLNTVIHEFKSDHLFTSRYPVGQDCKQVSRNALLSILLIQW